MDRRFHGKRLLVLGAGHFQEPVIRRAQEFGCRVIALDYLPENPGHRLADESEIISTVDVEAVAEAARRHSIDGVLTSGSDVSAPAVAYVAEQLGLAGNSYGAGRLLQQKDRFRTLQQRLSLPHPRFASSARSAELADILRRKGIGYPLLVKPVDASGSKGQSVVSGPDEVGSAFAIAKEFSRCGRVIAEELLASDSLEIVGDAFFQGGKLSFRHYGHSFFLKHAPARVPVGQFMPGLFEDEIASQADAQIQAIISETGLSCGCINFDALIVDGRLQIVDMGLRSGGNYFPTLIHRSTGFDMHAAAIYAAMGYEFPCPSLYAPAPDPVMCYMVNSVRDGIFERLSVDAELRPFVFETHLFVEKGETVETYSRGDRCLGAVLTVFPDMPTLLSSQARIEDLIAIDLAPVRPNSKRRNRAR